MLGPHMDSSVAGISQVVSMPLCWWNIPKSVLFVITGILFSHFWRPGSPGSGCWCWVRVFCWVITWWWGEGHDFGEVKLIGGALYIVACSWSPGWMFPVLGLSSTSKALKRRAHLGLQRKQDDFLFFCLLLEQSFSEQRVKIRRHILSTLTADIVGGSSQPPQVTVWWLYEVYRKKELVTGVAIGMVLYFGG